MSAPLLAVPNVSEGRDHLILERIAEAFTKRGATLLHLHADPHHHRAVFTLAGGPSQLAYALLEGFELAIESIDISDGRGQHPHVGAVDVAPIVYVQEQVKGAAVAEALLLADLVGEHLHVPVLLYGELAGGRARAQLRRGGPSTLRDRIARREIVPDFGPGALHPTAGATLLAVRPPLVAFNLELQPPAGPEEAKRIAALIREGGLCGIDGVKAIGITLPRPGQPPAGQVSINVEDPLAVPLSLLVQAVAAHAPIASGELVGLAPAASFDGFPSDIAMPRFDPRRQIIENALGL